MNQKFKKYVDSMSTSVTKRRRAKCALSYKMRLWVVILDSQFNTNLIQNKDNNNLFTPSTIEIQFVLKVKRVAFPYIAQK